MDSKIEGMIAPDIRPAEGKVDREREVRHGASAHGNSRSRRVQSRAQAAQRLVFRNRAHVVEDEGAGKAARVSGEGRHDDDRDKPPKAPRCYRCGRQRCGGQKHVGRASTWLPRFASKSGGPLPGGGAKEKKPQNYKK